MKTIISLAIFCGFSYAQVHLDMFDKYSAYGMVDAVEPDNHQIKSKAKEFMLAYPGDYVRQFCAVFDHLYRNWNYKLDPNGKEYYRDASETIETLTGDCDDYAILMVTLLLALDGDGRFVCVSGHAYPELYLGKDITAEQMDGLLNDISTYYSNKGNTAPVKSINYHNDSDGTYWLNMDYQQWHPGGTFIDSSPEAEHLVVYSSGKYRRACLNSE